MHPSAAEWFDRATTRWSDWPVDDLVAAKRDTTVSVVIPARNEAATIAGIVAGIRTALVEQHAVVDELVVMDSDSSDATAAIARAEGAEVHAVRAVRPELGWFAGKGEALWKSQFVTSGDVLVFIDADLTQWGTHFVTGLVGPLLCAPEIALVKGFYDRVLDDGSSAHTPQGGRVTELVARPLLNLRWPQLAAVVSPLAGEWAVRRAMFEMLPIPVGYGIELAVLLDVFASRGLAAIAQVDLGERAHSHQSVHDLGVMAAELLAVAGQRLGLAPIADGQLWQFDRSTEPPWRSRAVPVIERPPRISLTRGTMLRLGRRTFGDDELLIMAIVNRTPDSFYDQGATFEFDLALERVRSVLADGAEIVDIGGVKAAPGMTVDTAEEIDRTVPFIAAVRAQFPEVVISVDTWRAEVGDAACAAGADVVNDAWGGWDPELAAVAAAHDAALVCTHAGGVEPRTRPHRIEYDDVVADVLARTVREAERAVALGVAPESVLIDPGHDFGKNTRHSLEVTRRLGDLVATGWPVLVSLSNKDFVGETLGRAVGERLLGTLATTSISAWLGARVFRAHNIAETRQTLDMVATIRGTRPPTRTVRGLA